MVYCSAYFFSALMDGNQKISLLILVVFEMLKSEGTWNHWILEKLIASDSRTFYNTNLTLEECL